MLDLPDTNGYYVYILECKDRSYYTGWTTHPKQRFAAHQKGKGAKYTKVHPPLACVYLEQCESKSAALKREYEIKQMTRKQKEALIQKAVEQKDKG